MSCGTIYTRSLGLCKGHPLINCRENVKDVKAKNRVLNMLKIGCSLLAHLLLVRSDCTTQKPLLEKCVFFQGKEDKTRSLTKHPNSVSVDSHWISRGQQQSKNIQPIQDTPTPTQISTIDIQNS